MQMHDWATTEATVCPVGSNSRNNNKFKVKQSLQHIPELSRDDASVVVALGFRWRERRKKQDAGNDRYIGRKSK